VTIQVDHGAFDRATRLVAETADGLRGDHDQVQGEVADQMRSAIEDARARTTVEDVTPGKFVGPLT
jgi:hypothetical protein